MSKPISKVKNRLLQCIQGVSKNAWLFFAAPEKDFTRNRKLSFETMVKTLLCMEGGSLTNELMKRFGCRADIASTSAFVQQRGKILPGGKFCVSVFRQSQEWSCWMRSDCGLNPFLTTLQRRVVRHARSKA